MAVLERIMTRPIVYHIPVCPFSQRLEILLALKNKVDAVEFRVVDITRPQLRAAARLRADHVGLRTPDALQLVAARGAGCGTLVTNDRRLPTLPGLKVLQLSSLS